MSTAAFIATITLLIIFGWISLILLIIRVVSRLTHTRRRIDANLRRRTLAVDLESAKTASDIARADQIEAELRDLDAHTAP